MDLILLGALLSNSCIPLSGGTFSIDQPLFQSYMQEATNGTSDQTKRHWSYYVLIVVALTGSLVFLCFCSPALKWLLSRCLRSNGDEARTPLRDARCSRCWPPNYGTLSETVVPPPLIPKDTQEHTGGQEAPGEVPKASVEKRGDQPGTDSEITLEVEDAEGQEAPGGPKAPVEKRGDQPGADSEVTLEGEDAGGQETPGGLKAPVEKRGDQP
ncbi:uncharacterized protein LOC103280381 [Anolis carolinensis]|uniref:uncharacterized protein LOC103280381 n=1 Tax=Anolis carolinensis TaxID=28377 RepID=UPI000462C9CD|nr:PREDICTED: uncharacterized protein LOC103280381 [Anolis carolinensis]|eukprot:XP_008117419.1 PREDICTED: uncharacterized protein LOC103280381 [Anolis carolinensis]